MTRNARVRVDVTRQREPTLGSCTEPASEKDLHVCRQLGVLKGNPPARVWYTFEAKETTPIRHGNLPETDVIVKATPVMTLSQPERENTGVCGAVDALQTVHLQVREPVNKGGSSSEENEGAVTSRNVSKAVGQHLLTTPPQKGKEKEKNRQ
ncbi:hypothetical protein OUZ56_007808 [Daphnia magna]|uniref:Uncharacterized protein n=1 Tax=Daphnia magna TaxID=35525 RepID=A0ABR0AB42_9CRUS|nr:hypothetical protein OUZ56_007808 [Daphnia magna]